MVVALGVGASDQGIKHRRSALQDFYTSLTNINSLCHYIKLRLEKEESTMTINWGKLSQIAKAVVRAERGVENVSTPEPKRINVCEQIKCPYAYKTCPNSSSGCRKYLTALQCHLLSGHSELAEESTPYFLHSKVDSANIAKMKTENDSFFSGQPRKQEIVRV